ncbi:hypothetical protein KEJ27_09825 [Candidatus Bathyarchaeota archaeon]|nr:hypothetical protein [Candidatus Bathyarchaeota archaeon]
MEAIASYFANAYNFIAQNIFSFGQWLWSGIQGFANMLANSLIYIGRSIYNFFITIGQTIYDSITSLKTTFEDWFFNFIVGFRAKLKASIMFSVTTHIAWKSSEHVFSSGGVKGIADALLGIFLSPFIGSLMSNLIDGLIPTPTERKEIFPSLPSITFPSLVLEEKYPLPPAPSAPTAIVVGVGVTSEERVITIAVVDKLVPPTVTREATFIVESENVSTITPTVEVSTELIIP